MADPVTTNKGLTVPATGADPNAWGPILNENFSLIDAFLGSTTSLTLSAGTVTLNSSQTQAVRIALTGTLSGNVTIVVPQKGGYFYFHDMTTRGGYTITVTTGSTTGRTQNLPGQMCHLFTDGTNVWRVNEPEHGTLQDFSGFTIPPLWMAADGSAVSRTNYPQLLAALSFGTTGTITSGSNQITNVPNVPVGLVAPLAIPVEGPGIPTGTTVTGFSGSAGNYTLTISANATATNSSAAVTLLPHGQGDGATTFNLPDTRGRMTAAADSMGGTAASRLTTSSIGLTAVLGTGAGHQLLTAHSHGTTENPHNHTQNSHNHSLNNPAHSHTAGDSGHAHWDSGHNHSFTAPQLAAPFTNNYIQGGGDTTITANISNNTSTGHANIQTGYANVFVNSATTDISANAVTATNNPATTGLTVNSAGSGNAQNVPPVLVVNKIIYAGQ